MELYGILTKIKKKNLKTGYTEAVIRNQSTVYYVCGIIPNYPLKSPLKITCEEKKDGEKIIYTVHKVSLFAYEKESLIPFLCSFSSAYGIGKKEAQKLSDLSVDEFFHYIKTCEDLNALCSQREYRFLLQILQYLAFEDFYQYILSIDGNYHQAEQIFRKHGRDSERVIQNNPYVLLAANYPIEKCDQVALSSGMKSFDKKRLCAVVRHALALSQSNGNTRTSFHELCQIIRREDKKAGIYRTHPLFIAETLLSESFYVEKSDDIYIYIKEDYIYECTIASNLKRLKETARPYENNVLTAEDIEDVCEIKYSSEQKETFSIMNESGVKIITGGPGTGKTTLLNGLLLKYKEENPQNEIILCSPTGCAARRMQESTGMPACTIHQILKIRPFDARNEIRGEKLTADCVIVDESSMLDTFITARLLSSIKNGALLIFLGDIDQIESVGPGRILKDMIESGYVPVYRLIKNYRQGDNNPIVDNAINVCEGNAKLFTTEKFSIERYQSADEIIKALEDKSHIYKEENTSINEFKIFTPSKNRKFSTSTANLNRIIQNKYIKKDCDSIMYGANEFYVGDKVIFTKNNYKTGYYNGEEGIITHIHKKNDGFYLIVKADNDTVRVELTNMDDLDLAYAITAHKSQGSECKHAIIVIPKEPKSLLRRQLLYVEITRAKESVLIMSEKRAMEEAISTKHEIRRNTGLQDKLKKIGK